MALLIELTETYGVIREGKVWRIVDLKTGEFANDEEYVTMGEVVTAANGLEILR